MIRAISFLLILIAARSVLAEADSGRFHGAEQFDTEALYYLGEGQKTKAEEASVAAFRLRLTNAASSTLVYQAHQNYGNMLTALGHLPRAAEVFRNGAHHPNIEPRGQVKLLASLARLGLINHDFLRWGTRSMIRAREISRAHGLAQPELLDLRLADLLMIGGQTAGASKIYRALWQSNPGKRTDWFGEPALLFTSHVHGPTYRPRMLGGVLTETIGDIHGVENQEPLIDVASLTAEAD